MIITPNQHKRLSADPSSKTVKEWAAELQVDVDKLRSYVRRNNIKVKPIQVRILTIERVRELAKTHTCSEIAKVTGAAVGSVYRILSINKISPVGGYNKNRPDDEYFEMPAHMCNFQWAYPKLEQYFTPGPNAKGPKPRTGEWAGKK